MSSMNIIQKNKTSTVGIISDIEGLKNVGEFSVKNIEEWLKKVKLVLGDERDVLIEFKLSEDPKNPAYMIAASHDGADPKIAVVGTCRLDGKEWGKP
jgi:hypothetical protein